MKRLIFTEIQQILALLQQSCVDCVDFNLLLPNYRLLNPETICKLAICAGGNIKKNIFPHWHLFENGEIDIDYNTFIITIFEEYQYLNQELYIVTDEMLKKGVCFKTENMEDFITFIMEDYPETFNEDFIQPLDMIFFGFKSGQFFILHHDGLVIRIQIPRLP